MARMTPEKTKARAKVHSLAETSQQKAERRAVQHLANNLADELRAADTIIRVMLNALTTKQKLKLALHLENLGVSPEGMTRAQERHDELSRYDALQQLPNGEWSKRRDSNNPTKLA